MTDLVPIPVVLFERLARAGLDVDDILRRANLPRSRFNVAKPEGTTAEFFALWRAVEQSGADAGLGLRLGAQALTDEQNVAALVAMHSATLGDAFQRLARYKRLVDDVREALRATMSGDRPAIANDAKSLGMSVRALQRRLAGMGTTYQDLLDDVRHRSARRLLRSTNLDPVEVAFLLGFEEVNSFARAFHAWEGTTPARWRARRLTGRP
jgi:AraC-like DNA-binding protein